MLRYSSCRSRRERFELFVSRPVWDEAARGDAEAAAKRTAALDGIPVLLVSAEASEFADRLLATTMELYAHRSCDYSP